MISASLLRIMWTLLKFSFENVNVSFVYDTVDVLEDSHASPVCLGVPSPLERSCQSCDVVDCGGR